MLKIANRIAHGWSAQSLFSAIILKMDMWSCEPYIKLEKSINMLKIAHGWSVQSLFWASEKFVTPNTTEKGVWQTLLQTRFVVSWKPSQRLDRLINAALAANIHNLVRPISRQSAETAFLNLFRGWAWANCQNLFPLWTGWDSNYSNLTQMS